MLFLSSALRSVSFRLVLLAGLLVGSSVAGANPLKDLSDAQLAPYRYDPEQGGFAAQAGQRFMTDLKERDPGVAANVQDAVRYDLQQEEAAKFARQKRFVIAAYGVIWALVALFALTLWTRQRKLAAELADLESRLGATAK